MDEDDVYTETVAEINDLIAQVKQAMERYRSYPTEALSNVVWEKSGLLNEKADEFHTFFLELSAEEDIPLAEQSPETQEFESILSVARGVVDESARLAASYPDSQAHEYQRSEDRLWISAVAQARSQGLGSITARHLEIEKRAEQGIVAYWRTKGLSEDAAYAAAALEIAQLRSEQANQ